jgi:hypothetical protein
MKIHNRFTAVDNVCGWPQLRISSNQKLLLSGFNKPCHGKIEGDVACYVSEDDGESFFYQGTPVVHKATTNRMNHCSGFAHNGDFLAIVSGYSNRPKEKIYEGAEYIEKVFSQSSTLTPVIARSVDEGKTYSRVNLQFDSLASIIPFGEIIKLDDQVLMCSIYLVGTKQAKSFLQKDVQTEAGVLLSYDDGYTWNDYFIIAKGLNETSIAKVGNKVIAAARTVKNQHIQLYESFDRGKTWMFSQAITLLQQVPASTIVLKDGRVLITYGCRNDVKSISYRISHHTLPKFEEAVVLQEIDTDGDMGYPSTVQLEDGSLVTAFYADKDTGHNRYHIGIIKWEI